MGRSAAVLGLLLGSAGLVLQFVLTIPASMEAGRGLVGSVVFYFSFFTILTNIAAVCVYVSDFRQPASAAFFARPRVTAGVAVAIAVVSIVYAAVLARLWQPQGLSQVADTLLHYVAPALFVLWWLAFKADGKRRWRDIPFWLIYPLLYLIFIFIRAPFAQEVPYPFLDLKAQGPYVVLLGIAGVFALFVVFGVLAVLADHAIGRPRRAQS